MTPPAQVTRTALRHWQQAVFWGLHVYTVVMLIVMAFGFAQVTGG
jgi:predicted cobalt transporter CbtA